MGCRQLYQTEKMTPVPPRGKHGLQSLLELTQGGCYYTLKSGRVVYFFENDLGLDKSL